jgi:hypothetical protein
MAKQFIDTYEIWHELSRKAEILKYDTGWINRSDWTNVHMGSSTTKNADSDVDHNFGLNLSDLIIKVLISEFGTDATSFEIPYASYEPGAGRNGITIYQADTNSFTVQTSLQGFRYIDGAGGAGMMDTEDWYYKIIVYGLRYTI